MRSTTSPFLGALVICVMAPSALADTLSLEPAKDNTLYESSTGGLSNGSGIYMFVGRTNQSVGSIRRGLVQFDIAGNIPAGSVITNVSLRINVNRSRGSATNASLHRATQDWGEGTSNAGGNEGRGASSATGDATWLHTFFSSSTWTNAGGDFDPTASATISIGGNGNQTWSSEQMRLDVQSWLDQPATNFGYVIVGDEANRRRIRRLASRENSVAPNRPTLTIEYCPPTGTASWTNYGAGWPGTNGIPNFTSTGDPVLCANISLNVDNSSGTTSVAVMFIGLATANIPTQWGGTLLVSPINIIPFTLPGGGVSLPFNVLCEEAFCGVSIYLQVLQVDNGASAGISFTPGLDLLHGN